MARKRPTEEDRDEALRRVLSGLVDGADVFELAASVADLHPKNDTFPGEVFMGLAADAMDMASATWSRVRKTPPEDEGCPATRPERGTVRSGQHGAVRRVR